MVIDRRSLVSCSDILSHRHDDSMLEKKSSKIKGVRMKNKLQLPPAITDPRDLKQFFKNPDQQFLFYSLIDKD